MDVRHPLKELDQHMIAWAVSCGTPIHILLTKADKLRPKAIEDHVESYKNTLLETWEEFPNYFITSSTNYDGKEALLNYIDSINADLENSTNKLPFQ